MSKRRALASETEVGQSLLKLLSSQGRLCADLARKMGLSGAAASGLYRVLRRLKAEQLAYNEGYYWFLGVPPVHEKL